MNSFFWNGIDRLGNDRKGILLASSEQQLKDMLLDQGIALLKYKHKREKFSFLKFIFQKKVSLTKKAFFFEQLFVLIDGGVNLLEALKLVCSQIRSKRLKNVILKIINQIRSGNSFSDALEKQGMIFDSFIVHMVRAGENSGKLSFVLERISGYLNSRLKLVKHLKHAAFAPCLTLFFAVFIFLGIFIFVIPQFEFFFNSMGKQIPAMTKFIIGLSSFFRSFAFIPIFIIVLFSLLLVKGILGFVSVNKIKDKVFLKIYFLGKIFLLYDLISFSQILSMSLKSGINLKEALRFSSKVARNSVFVENVRLLESQIERGQSFAESLKFARNKIFPDNFIAIVQVGEQTGKLDLMIQKSVFFFQEELNRKLKLLVNAFQPIIMIIVGLLIFFLILSVYLPIFNMAGAW